MSLAAEVAAIRSSAGLSRASHVALVRVDGSDAFELLQLASTQAPYVREGRVRHSLFLRDDASVLADTFIVKVDDGFLVLAEGATGDDDAAIVAWLEGLRERAPTKSVTIQAMRPEWTALGVDGPYAWEAIADVLGPPILGMPYLTLLRRDDVVCVRAGKTGEYGYLLLAPTASAAELEAKLGAVGAALDLAPVSREALDVCALENWHFSMRNISRNDFATPLTPLELQLQWRVAYTREFVGAAALRARRAEGPKARVTCFVAEGPVAAGQRVRLGALDVGEIVSARASPTLGATVGAALLTTRFAHPHLTLAAIAPEGALALRTCTASLVDNASLRVHPLKNSYAKRMEVPSP